MRQLLIALLIGAGLLLTQVAGIAGAAAPTVPLSIRTATGTHDFKVELAVTPDQQRLGLMYRRSLAPDAGMLFLYENGSNVTMWMANTYIPLDMIFIGSTGRITHIAERTVPQSTELIGSNGPCRAVLEVNGGTASRLGIRVGDQVEYEAFK